MTTNKVFIGTRFDSDRCKSLERIAKKLHISKNAVIENAFDIYTESVLGVITPVDNTSDNTIQLLEERIKALELTIAELQPKVITPSDNTFSASQGDNTLAEAPAKHLKLTKNQLRDRYDIGSTPDSAEAFGLVRKLLANGQCWTAEDGLSWFRAADGTFTTEPPQAASSTHTKPPQMARMLVKARF